MDGKVYNRVDRISEETYGKVKDVLSLRKMSRMGLAKQAAADETEGTIESHDRPTNRLQCIERGLGTETPCPYVSCKYHLYLEVTENGNIHLQHPDKEPDELEHTCLLALIDANPDGLILEEIGKHLQVTRERARQIEVSALAKTRVHRLTVLQETVR